MPRLTVMLTLFKIPGRLSVFVSTEHPGPAAMKAKDGDDFSMALDEDGRLLFARMEIDYCWSRCPSTWTIGKYLKHMSKKMAKMAPGIDKHDLGEVASGKFGSMGFNKYDAGTH